MVARLFCIVCALGFIVTGAGLVSSSRSAYEQKANMREQLVLTTAHLRAALKGRPKAEILALLGASASERHTKARVVTLGRYQAVFSSSDELDSLKLVDRW